MKKIGINKLGNKTTKVTKIKAKPVVKVSPKMGSFKSKATSIIEESDLIRRSGGITRSVSENSITDGLGNTNFSDYSLDKMTLI